MTDTTTKKFSGGLGYFGHDRDSDWVTSKVVQSIHDYSAFFPQTQKGKVHVTEIANDCLAQSFFNRKYPERPYNIEDMMKSFCGKALHAIPMTAKHELRLEWEGIIANLDEYENGVIFDKKFQWVEFERTKISKRHKLQGEYYKVEVIKNGLPFKNVFIVYFLVMKPSMLPRTFKIETRKTDIIANEMLCRRDALLTAFASDVPPRPSPSWLCSTCRYLGLCTKLLTKKYYVVRKVA
jgi:hypothetical protein